MYFQFIFSIFNYNILSMEIYKKEEYLILDKLDDDFEIREKQIQYPISQLIAIGGIDKGMILKVLKIHHSVQFCKNINFNNGYKIFVEVIKAAHSDYKKGMKWALIIPSHLSIENYLKEKYTIEKNITK